MLRRAHLLTTSIIVVLSLLFSQLALAAYVCPAQEDTGAMLEMMAAGVPCDGMDLQQPVLCHEHSTTAAQSAEPFKVPMPALAAVGQVLTLPLTLGVWEAIALPTSSEPDARPPPDSVFLSTLRLRV